MQYEDIAPIPRSLDEWARLFLQDPEKLIDCPFDLRLVKYRAREIEDIVSLHPFA